MDSTFLVKRLEWKARQLIEAIEALSEIAFTENITIEKCHKISLDALIKLGHVSIEDVEAL